MSTATLKARPDADAVARARAKETIWRLAALAFGHPIAPFHEALVAGAFHRAFDGAWVLLTGRRWPQAPPSQSFADLEAGYIAAFHHRARGRQVASLMAGEHEAILDGQARPAFLLNLTAFYRHFGLRHAIDDEGRSDEADHLACLLEFMAVLAHLEATALAAGRDPGAARRAQRDFLHRYVGPLLAILAEALRPGGPPLDPTLTRLVRDLDGFAEREAVELEADVGPYRSASERRPDAAADDVGEVNLWA